MFKKIFALALFFAAFTGMANAQQTVTPNVNFQVPAYQQQNWQVPIDYNFSVLDQILGGTQALPTGSTPQVNQGATWITANTGSTSIVNFLGGYPGQTIRVVCGSADTFTSISNGANISISSPFSCPSANYATFTLIGSVWTAGGTGSGGGGSVGCTLVAQQILFATSGSLCGGNNNLTYNQGSNTIAFAGTFSGGATTTGWTMNGFQPGAAGTYSIGGTLVPYLNAYIGSSPGQYSLLSSAATTARNILFPDASGTVCLTTTCTGTVSGQMTGYIPLASGPTAITGPSPLDYGQTLAGTVNSSVNLQAPQLTATGLCQTGTAGCQMFEQGTPATSIPSGTLIEQAPASVTPYLALKPSAAATGLLKCTLASTTCTQTYGPQYVKLRCEPGIDGGGSAISAGSHTQTTCYNDSLVTWTITGIKCFTDNNGTSTLNAAGHTLGALLTGAVTCSNSWAAGTQSANVALTAGDWITFTFVADGTSQQTTWVVSITQ